MIGLGVVFTITLALAGLFSPGAAAAQQAAKVARIGLLATDPSANLVREAFIQGLRDLGYIEGRDVVIEYRYSEGHLDRFPALAAELVALKVDVIVASGTPAALAANKRPEPSRLSSLLLPIPSRAGSSPALRGRTVISRDRPSSTRS